MSSTEFPTTPRDVADAPLRVLVDAYMAHAARLVDAHHNIGQQLAAAELARHAVAALALQHALGERILLTRWANVRDALTFGVTLDDTAAAMALDVDEVQAGLRSWAAGQASLHDSTGGGLGMTRAEYDEVLALVDDPEVTT